jgi:hypothetical protein
VSGMLKRFESGFVVKQAKTFTPQEVCLHFIKMFSFLLYFILVFVCCDMMYVRQLRVFLKWGPFLKGSDLLLLLAVVVMVLLMVLIKPVHSSLRLL